MSELLFMPRTDNEIVSEIEDTMGSALPRAEKWAIITTLRSYLPIEATEHWMWDPPRSLEDSIVWGALPRDQYSIAKEMQQALAFVYGYISDDDPKAFEAVQQYVAWLWMLGRDDLLEQIDERLYHGKYDRDVRRVCGGIMDLIREQYRWEYPLHPRRK